MLAARASTRRSVPRGHTDFGAPGEFSQDQRRLRLERNVAMGLRQEPHRGIRIGGVPTRELGVVIQLIVRVPAKNHIAEPEILVERRQEFFAAQIFAAHDAVGVEHADLDVLDAAFGQDLAYLSCPLGSFSHITYPFGRSKLKVS
jgi:hypothetical protein